MVKLLFELACSTLPGEAKAALRTSFEQFSRVEATTSPTHVRGEVRRLLGKYGAKATAPPIALQTGAE